MGWYTVLKGGIPFAVFMKLILIPMSFLLIGVATIGINVSENQDVFLFYISVFEINIGVSLTGIKNAACLFFKALSAVSCLYYLSLSTPMVDLLQALGKLKVPKLFIELMGLIYRFVFVLLETVDMMFTAQKSRMGYSGISSGYRSLAALASTLFIRAYKRYDELYTSLESRGYDGELNVLDTHFKIQPLMFTMPIAINLSLVALVLILRHFTGGLL
jgi:cobalt/nickel transport system permease protein